VKTTGGELYDCHKESAKKVSIYYFVSPPLKRDL